MSNIDNHAKAVLLHDIIESVRHIQAVCNTSRVADMAFNINDKAHRLIDGLGLREHINDIRERRIDGTN